MTVLRPWCSICGWRKGGTDSWDGVACKCGHIAPPMPHDRDGKPALSTELDQLAASIIRCCDIARARGDTELSLELRRMHWAACDLITKLEERTIIEWPAESSS